MSELRPSFQERDRYLDLLSTAYADGRLDEAEFETRSNAVLAAVTHRDAIAQFQGLPQPNIVPVQAPPSAFRPLPQPPQAFQPRPIARRGLMAGAVGVAAVAGLGLAGLVSFSEVSDEMTGEFPDPVFEPGFSPLQDNFRQAGSTLSGQGFDTISEFAITQDQIQGTAGRSRAPGEGSSFSWFTDGSLQVTSAEGGSASHALPLDEAELVVITAEDVALANLTGVITKIELVWEGEVPSAKVTATQPDGWVQVDASGQVIAMEVP